MTRKIPVLIFTGFLGSGKTTIVNHLINANKDIKIGVVVNEFGEVGFDSQIIQTEEDIKVEISNGCACCVVRDDLESGVQALITDQPELEYIFIEASGLAEPGPIAQTFLHNISNDKSSYLDATVCVIDTVNFVSNWDEFELLQKQIAHSDIVVLNKTDQAGSKLEEVKKMLIKSKPDLHIMEYDSSNQQSLSVLMDGHSFEMTEVTSAHHDHDHEHHHHHEHEDFDELVYVSHKTLDPQKMDEVFKSDSFKNIVRAKGFLNFPGQDTSMVYQQVGHGKQLSKYSTKLDSNKLVFIGKNLDDSILHQLQTCEI
jgi:G3E family GTPase